jgi:PhoPQ-activated pathogenicity-related protein
MVAVSPVAHVGDAATHAWKAARVQTPEVGWPAAGIETTHERQHVAASKVGVVPAAHIGKLTTTPAEVVEAEVVAEADK